MKDGYCTDVKQLSGSYNLLEKLGEIHVDLCSYAYVQHTHKGKHVCKPVVKEHL